MNQLNEFEICVVSGGGPAAKIFSLAGAYEAAKDFFKGLAAGVKDGYNA